MESNYKSPTIFNAVDMKLSECTGKIGSLSMETPIEGAWLPAVALSAALTVVIGRKDVGKRSPAILKRTF